MTTMGLADAVGCLSARQRRTAQREGQSGHGSPSHIGKAPIGAWQPLPHWESANRGMAAPPTLGERQSGHGSPSHIQGNHRHLPQSKVGAPSHVGCI